MFHQKRHTNRPRFMAGKHFYNYSVLVLAPYGDHWRSLRRICATEIFSFNRLKLFQSVIKDEIKHLLLRLSRVSVQDFEKVELKSAIMDLTFNNIMRMISGKRYYGEDVVDAGEAEEVRELIAEIFKVSEATNLVDFLPMLKVISKFEKRAMNISKRMDGFLQKLVDEHRSKKGEIVNTMIDHLLSMQESQPEYYTDEIIKGLIWMMVLGGTDSAAVTLEWAMCNLLNHPNILKKAKEEIDKQVSQECLVDETDLAHLPYLTKHHTGDTEVVPYSSTSSPTHGI